MEAIGHVSLRHRIPCTLPSPLQTHGCSVLLCLGDLRQISPCGQSGDSRPRRPARQHTPQAGPCRHGWCCRYRHARQAMPHATANGNNSESATCGIQTPSAGTQTAEWIANHRHHLCPSSNSGSRRHRHQRRGRRRLEAETVALEVYETDPMERGSRFYENMTTTSPNPGNHNPWLALKPDKSLCRMPLKY